MEEYVSSVLELHLVKITFNKPPSWVRKNEGLQLVGELVYPRRRIASRVYALAVKHDSKSVEAGPLSSGLIDTLIFKEAVEGPFGVRFSLLKIRKNRASDVLLTSFVDPAVLRKVFDFTGLEVFEAGFAKEYLVRLFGNISKSNPVPPVMGESRLELESSPSARSFEEDTLPLLARRDIFPASVSRGKKIVPSRRRRPLVKEGEQLGNVVVRYRMV